VGTRSSQPGRAGRDPEQGSGRTLIYGRNPVREALSGRRLVHTILVARADLERQVGEWSLAAVPPAPRGRAARVQLVTPAELSATVGSGDHQDIAAVVDPYPYLEADQLLRNLSLLVALDQVQDPHNLGAIIRTAEGAGAGVLIPRHRAAEITAAVVKASAGATEHASVARVRNLADALSAAKKAGFWIYGAAAGAGQSYTAQDYTYPTCFVVGSEGEGLGRRVAALCDVLVSLPQVGRVSSLNVSVSAGILLYEAVRQRERERAAEEPAPAPRSGAGSPKGITP
jgi:23S rRNA (guanosine2251-2'-O)-methyltransferase